MNFSNRFSSSTQNQIHQFANNATNSNGNNSSRLPIYHQRFKKQGVNIQITVQPTRPFYISGNQLKGTIHITNQSSNSLLSRDLVVNQLKLELIGIEQIDPSTFNSSLTQQLMGRLRNKICQVSGDLDMGEFTENPLDGSLELPKGNLKVPFDLNIPLRLPSSNDWHQEKPTKRPISIRYLILGSIEVQLPTNPTPILLKHTAPIILHEQLPIMSTVNPSSRVHRKLRQSLLELPQTATTVQTISNKLKSKIKTRDTISQMQGSTSSGIVEMSLWVPRLLWVCGGLVAGKLSLLGSLKLKVARIDLELVEVDQIGNLRDINANNNCESVNETIDTLYEEGGTDVGSNTLINSTQNSHYVSSHDSDDAAPHRQQRNHQYHELVNERVVTKRTIKNHPVPSQIDLSEEIRVWNVQLALPPNLPPTYQSSTASLAYHLRVHVQLHPPTINPTPIKLRISLPIRLTNPLTIEGDPYTYLRDGVIVTTPHMFNMGYKYRVYEQSMVELIDDVAATKKRRAKKGTKTSRSNQNRGHGLAGVSNTSLLETMAITQSHPNLIDNHVPQTDDPPEGNLMAPELSLDSNSSNNNDSSIVSDTDDDSCANKNDMNSMSCKPQRHSMTSRASSIKILAPHFRCRSTTSVTNKGQHRRTQSEANHYRSKGNFYQCPGQLEEEFFFKANKSGDFPEINNSWDWYGKPVIDGELNIDSSQQDHEDTDVEDKSYTVKFPMSPTKNHSGDTNQPKSFKKLPPWREQQIVNNNSKIRCKSMSGMDDLLSGLGDSDFTPTPISRMSTITRDTSSRALLDLRSPPQKAIVEDVSDIKPTDNNENALPPPPVNMRQLRKKSFHPAIIARKYSFPPKINISKDTAISDSGNNNPFTNGSEEDNNLVTSPPLKSALAKHKRSHTYSGTSPREVRFALDDAKSNKGGDGNGLRHHNTLPGSRSPAKSPKELKLAKFSPSGHKDADENHNINKNRLNITNRMTLPATTTTSLMVSSNEFSPRLGNNSEEENSNCSMSPSHSPTCVNSSNNHNLDHEEGNTDDEDEWKVLTFYQPAPDIQSIWPTLTNQNNAPFNDCDSAYEEEVGDSSSVSSSGTSFVFSLNEDMALITAPEINWDSHSEQSDYEDSSKLATKNDVEDQKNNEPLDNEVIKMQDKTILSYPEPIFINSRNYQPSAPSPRMKAETLYRLAHKSKRWKRAMQLRTRWSNCSSQSSLLSKKEADFNDGDAVLIQRPGFWQDIDDQGFSEPGLNTDEFHNNNSFDFNDDGDDCWAPVPHTKNNKSTNLSRNVTSTTSTTSSTFSSSSPVSVALSHKRLKQD